MLILAGDIAPGLRGLGAFFKYDKPVIYVPGNHEYYGENLPGLRAAMRLYAQPAGITVLDQEEAVIGGVRFLGATLWTDFALFGESRREQAISYADRHLNDYITIRNAQGGWFSARQSWELHAAAVKWLKDSLERPFPGQTVVITHHGPHPKSVHKRHNGQLLSAAFVSDLTPLMGKAALWIHGHIHNSFDYAVAGTRIIANPKGYGGENKEFIPDYVVEVPGT